MKYTQFLELHELLESNKTDLNKWKESDIILIKEADETSKEGESSGELKTDSKATDWLTKKGRMRKSLEKQAKKLQDGINQTVADKFLKPITDLKVKTYQKMAEVGKGKQPKEIVAALKMDLQQIQNIQNKQMNQIDKYAQTVVEKNTKKIESVIAKKGLKETATADLESYWALLTSQILNNLWQKIGEEGDKIIGQVIKDEGILKAAKQINAALNKPQRDKSAGLKKEIEKLKLEIKAKDEKEKENPPQESAEDLSAEDFSVSEDSLDYVKLARAGKALIKGNSGEIILQGNMGANNMGFPFKILKSTYKGLEPGMYLAAKSIDKDMAIKGESAEFNVKEGTSEDVKSGGSKVKITKDLGKFTIKSVKEILLPKSKEKK